MKTRFSLLMLLLVLLVVAPAAGAPAPTFNASLEKARLAYGKQPAASLAALRQAVELLWERLPFGLEQARLLEAPPDERGQYIPRGDRPFKPDETLVIYLEPVGFKVRRQDGMFDYKLEADFKLTDAWGHEVGASRRFSQLSGPSFSFPDRLALVVSYDLLGLTSGDYKVETTLRDVLGNQKYTLNTSLRVEGAGTP